MIAVVYFPTIMSGPVLRWFTTEERDGVLHRKDELANAGREGFFIPVGSPATPAEVWVDGQMAAEEIKLSVHRRAPESWRRYITHESLSFLGTAIREVEP